MWGSFEILESYVGERVNKIRFVGSINKRNQVKKPSVREIIFGEKGRKRLEERRDQERLQSAKLR